MKAKLLILTVVLFATKAYADCEWVWVYDETSQQYVHEQVCSQPGETPGIGIEPIGIAPIGIVDIKPIELVPSNCQQEFICREGKDCAWEVVCN